MRRSHSGRIPLERILQAQEKIFATPAHAMGLFKPLAQNDSITTVTEVLQHSQTIYGSVPLSLEKFINLIKFNSSSATHLRNLIVVDRLLMCYFFYYRVSAITLSQQMGYTTQIIDYQTQSTDTLEGNNLVLLPRFIRGNPFRGSARVNQAAENLLKKLLISSKLQALVVYRSCYTVQQFIPLFPTDIKMVFSYGQMPAAQDSALRALFRM